TPSRPNGSLDLAQVEKVCCEIGGSLSLARPDHVVIARSTMLPGSTHGVVIPALEAASGLWAGQDFGVCVNPEFLREGTSIRDFRHPPFTLVGSDDPRWAAVVGRLYQNLDASLVVAPTRVAEMVKYTSNAYHAVKVVFANEIGAICKQQGIDSHAVMDIFRQDTKLNVSAAYLKPGFAFGGSCLPKDLRALTYHARQLDVEAPLLESVMASNRHHIERALGMVHATGLKRVGVLGFSFKTGTDDLRESPLVELIERLIGKGYEVRVFDRNVSLAQLQGANRAYIQQSIPHIASLMCEEVEEVVTASDVIVIGNGSPEFATVPDLADENKVVIDLVRMNTEIPSHPRYEGLGW
ncbi:MAG: nucleotide sugar dehydrogenase, partial [Propionibacteriales bacterium]|nr:nucleotide sugar dehydrogenase [Propionibacteriales bacterium]